MVDSDGNAWKEIFDSLDEEERLVAQLTGGSKAFDYLMGLEDFQRHIVLAVQKLRNVVAQVPSSANATAVFDCLKEFGFYLFSLGSVHLSLENLLYEGAKDLAVDTILHPIMDAWKYSAPVQLMKAYRNRLQHRHYAVPNLKVEVRTNLHPLGASQAIDFALSDVEQQKLLEGVRATNGLRQECQNFLDNKMKGQPGGVLVLVGEYQIALANLLGRIKSELRFGHSDEFTKMQDLVQKIDGVRAALHQRGIVNPLQLHNDVVESAAREWIVNAHKE